MVIEKKLVKYNYSNGNNPIAIVVHETGNYSKGSDADAHYRYWNARNQGGSAHYVVDENKIIQVIEHKNQSWHNGVMYNESKATRREINNSNSIGIEMCVNNGSDYEKVLVNTIQLIQMLMRDLNIKIENVLNHEITKGKHCPAKLIDSGRWNEFISKVANTDTELIDAVNILHEKGVISTVDAWTDVSKFKGEYYDAIISNYLRIVHKQVCCNNDCRLVTMYRLGLITDLVSWLTEITAKNMRFLILKMADSIKEVK